jgi:uncharacterized membrane protein (UPF0127 family)
MAITSMSASNENLGDVTVRGAGGQIVCERCRVPETIRGRMRGLLGRSELPAGEGVLLRRVSGIHTLFMRFVIDAVFLDREQVVVAIDSEVPPWRFASQRRARAVLELAAGEGARRGVRVGERLTFTPLCTRKEQGR